MFSCSHGALVLHMVHCMSEEAEAQARHQRTSRRHIRRHFASIAFRGFAPVLKDVENMRKCKSLLADHVLRISRGWARLAKPWLRHLRSSGTSRRNLSQHVSAESAVFPDVVSEIPDVSTCDDVSTCKRCFPCSSKFLPRREVVRMTGFMQIGKQP